MSFVMLSED